jgi:hypothetical protein
MVGYVIDRPMRLRDALAPLLEAFALDPVERRDGVVLAGRSGVAAMTLGDDDLAWPEDRDAPVAAVRTLTAPVQTLRLRFIDAARDYQTGAVIVRRETAARAAPTSTRRWCWPPPRPGPWPSACWRPPIRARRRPPVAPGRPAPGARRPARPAQCDGDGATWRVTRIDLDEHPRAQLAPVVDPVRAGGDLDWSPAPPREVPGPPVLHVLDLPGQADERPLVAVAASPWRPFDLHAGVGPRPCACGRPPPRPPRSASPCRTCRPDRCTASTTPRA